MVLCMLILGWMYAADHTSTKWDAKKKPTHKFQRRNWRRVRIRQLQQDVFQPTLMHSSMAECWEYGRKQDNNHTFHAVRGSLDSYRRRKWIRKLVYNDKKYEASKM